MYLLVTYDVATSTPAGERRLRRVAKICLDYGQRVQNSVFECKVAPADYVAFKKRIITVIEPATDSVRFYNLGNKAREHAEHIGKNEDYDIDGILLVD